MLKNVNLSELLLKIAIFVFCFYLPLILSTLLNQRVAEIGLEKTYETSFKTHTLQDIENLK